MIAIATWLAIIAAVFLVVERVQTLGFRDGYRRAWLVVLFLFPAWLHEYFGTLRIDPRSVAALTVLLMLLLQPHTPRRTIWLASDFGAVIMVGLMSISQMAAGSLAPLSPFDRMRDWLLPYLMGRLFIEAAGDVDRVLPTFCWIAGILSLFAIVEGIAKINLIDAALGKTWTEWNMGELGERWGMKRANGPQSHPIYFSATLGLLLPWILRASREAAHGRGPGWWRWLPWLLIAGVVATGSRSGQVMVLGILACDLFFHHPRLRLPLLLLGAVGAIIFFLFREEIVALLARYAEEPQGTQMVKINGIEYEYTGTKHRDLLYLVYQDGIRGAGWLGYGPMLEKMPRDPEMPEQFKSVDNHYLLFFLEYGDLGLIGFAFFAGCAILNLIPTLWDGGPEAGLAAGLLGGMIGILLILRGVYLSMDFGTVWLFTAGVTGAIARQRYDDGSAPVERPVS